MSFLNFISLHFLFSSLSLNKESFMFSFDKITHKNNKVQRVLSQRQSVILSFTLDGRDVAIPRCKTALPDEWGIHECCCCSICNDVLQMMWKPSCRTLQSGYAVTTRESKQTFCIPKYLIQEALFMNIQIKYLIYSN